MNICIFGDSIIYGAFDSEKGGWANRLRLHSDSENDFRDIIYNLGVSGDNTEYLLQRFNTEADFREPEVIIFAIGINDSQFLISENRNRVSIENFEKNIKELITQARKIIDKIIFIGLTPVDEEKTTPILWDRNKMYKNEYLEKYDGKIKEVCKSENVDFIDIFSEMKKEDYKAMLLDGLHPDSKGHEWIAKKIIDKLKI